MFFKYQLFPNKALRYMTSKRINIILGIYNTGGITRLRLGKISTNMKYCAILQHSSVLVYLSSRKIIFDRAIRLWRIEYTYTDGYIFERGSNHFLNFLLISLKTISITLVQIGRVNFESITYKHHLWISPFDIHLNIKQ